LVKTENAVHMKIALFTKEYPPRIYGGAGVHVEYLSRYLASLGGGAHDISVLCFGEQKEASGNLKVEGITTEFPIPYRNVRHKSLLDALFRNILMSESLETSDIVHCHTWYTYLAGCLAKQFLQIPLVITVHSLEPQRPWKEEQLGSAYRASAWLEQTALSNADGIIAVSDFMKKAITGLYGINPDRIRTIPNGVDIEEYRPVSDKAALTAHGINPEVPFILFVGRISRQKGIFYLLDALRYLTKNIQIVLVASDPDTEEFGTEMAVKIEEIRARTSHTVVWINRFLPRSQIIPLYTNASLFVCPSIYEPFGLINIEAMACGIPVVASAVSGIVDVVVDGQTGVLVPFEPTDSQNPAPRDPVAFSRSLAEVIDRLLGSPDTIAEMGRKARQRVIDHYNWKRVAERTLDFYQELVRNHSEESNTLEGGNAREGA
jgi:alpha-maltose-1-phosphate synthase